MAKGAGAVATVTAGDNHDVRAFDESSASVAGGAANKVVAKGGSFAMVSSGDANNVKSLTGSSARLEGASNNVAVARAEGFLQIYADNNDVRVKSAPAAICTDGGTHDIVLATPTTTAMAPFQVDAFPFARAGHGA